MKLYYSPGACSLAPHIALEEMKFKYETEKVDLKEKTTAEGDYRKINPKGNVPALKTNQGDILTEAAVILQYLADQKPDMKMIPPLATWERYRCLEWLNFIASELHKGFGPLFKADQMVRDDKTQEELKQFARETLVQKFAIPSRALEKGPYLMGSSYSVADCYLFVMLTWAQKNEVDLSHLAPLQGFYERMQQRAAIQRVFKSENLEKAVRAETAESGPAKTFPDKGFHSLQG